MSGVEPASSEEGQALARRSADVMWSADTASRRLGMDLLEVGPGRAVVAMTVREDMVNGWDICHGGLIATLADSAFAVACNSRGTVTVASGFDVSFLTSARLGDELRAEAREVALRGRSGLYDVTVTRTSEGVGQGEGVGEGVVVAEFRGRSRSLARSNPGLVP